MKPFDKCAIYRGHLALFVALASKGLNVSGLKRQRALASKEKLAKTGKAPSIYG